MMGWTRRYHGLRALGLENVPAEGPAIFLANHGYGKISFVLLYETLHRHFGRLPRALGNHKLWRWPALRAWLLRMGVVDGNPENARRLLEAGEWLMAAPGGEREENRRAGDRPYRLLWENRLGFARLAIRTQVPIIPVAQIGVEEIFYVPLSGIPIGRSASTGTHRFLIRPTWGLSPIPSFFFGVLTPPLPVRISLHFHPPISPPADPALAGDEAAVRRFQEEVWEASQLWMDDSLARHQNKGEMA